MEAAGQDELTRYVDQLINVYESQPDALVTAYGKYSPEQTAAPLAAGEWSPHQVLAHVIAAEREAFLPRLERLLDEEQPRLVNWDEAAWMQSEYEAEADAGELLAWIANRRLEMTARLRQIQDTDWNRSGLHPTQGERTLLWWLEYAVDHVRDHLGQLGQ